MSNTLKIIQICKKIGRQAHLIYNELFKTEKDPDFIKLWKKMAEEEKLHVGFWERLLILGENMAFPNIVRIILSALSFQ